MTTLARPIYSMNFLIFRDFGQVPGDFLENHQFMENKGQAKLFHSFFSKEFMEYTGEANTFNEFWGFIRPALRIIGGPQPKHDFDPKCI